MTRQAQDYGYRSQWNSISTIRLRVATAALALAVVLAPGVIATTPAQAQTFTTLVRFDVTNGFQPLAGLVQATDGNLYGTTVSGGTIGSCGPGATCGNVFKITPTGALTPLRSFDITDGADPEGTLVQATDGNFYGTTTGGGANGQGTIFKITPTGTLTTLYTFCSGCTHGAMPFAGVIQASDGNFYGTAALGGFNEGLVFNITPTGTLTPVYIFCAQTGCTDGEQPKTGLVQATNGNFYGTTQFGGTSGDGTIFEITPSGLLTALYSFCSQTNCTDGYASSALIQATDRNLYGTTEGGGSSGSGTIFKITPSLGALTTIYTFCSQGPCTDGAFPLAGLVQASDGNFYGTTTGGGANGYGTIFKITASGALTTLYSFCSQTNCTDGYSPEAALVQHTNGTLYGTTASGGRGGSACSPNGCGTVFNLSIGLGPFVETQRTSGVVGMEVKILGTNLTGATSVTFNGTAAVFEVDSSSLITATVPTGATTGRVQVITPRGTLTSNVPFRVLP